MQTGLSTSVDNVPDMSCVRAGIMPDSPEMSSLTAVPQAADRIADSWQHLIERAYRP